MGTSKNSFSMTRSRFPLGNIRLRRADLRPRRGEDGTTRHRNKSTAVLRHSELRSVAEPQQCQSKFCHCTRLLQQSSFKVLKSIQAEHYDRKLVWDHDRGAEVDAKGINTASIHHFCAYALVDATRQWACKHARCTRFGQQSFLLHTHFTKASMRDHSHYVLKHKCSCF
jgi:hypothetical protein